MRAFAISLLILIAGCARPVTQSATPMPMAAGCPMMHGGAAHAMPGMAMAVPADSSAAHHCPCPMHAEAHAMSHDAAAPAPADSTHSMAGCPMCAGGHCPMHPATPPGADTHSH